MLDAVASRFRLLGDPTRLRILSRLFADGEATVQALAEGSGQSHANVSKHLRLLAAEGLVASRREGTFAHYRISDPSLERVCAVMCAQLTEGA